MNAIKSILSAITSIFSMINKVASAGNAEASKIRNASIKSLLNEQPLTDEEIATAKKLMEDF